MARARIAPRTISPMPRNSCSRPSTAPRSSVAACVRLPEPAFAGVTAVLGAVAVGRGADPLEGVEIRFDLPLDGPQVAITPHGTNGVSEPSGIAARAQASITTGTIIGRRRVRSLTNLPAA